MISKLIAMILAAVGGGVALPPAAGVADYQLGGAYEPASNVQIVTRDRTEKPAPGRYNICYVNAFQTQPGELDFWQSKHPSLLLHHDGELLIDDNWPDEVILDLRTAAKRAEAADVVGAWFDGCAKDGFDAIEPDNLDSWTRSKGMLKESDALAFARLLVDRAHASGLAIAQKNTADWSGKKLFDFAVTEECEAYDECGVYTDAYGSHVIEIEYADAPFKSSCAARAGDISIIRRDLDVVPRGAGRVRLPHLLTREVTLSTSDPDLTLGFPHVSGKSLLVRLWLPRHPRGRRVGRAPGCRGRQAGRACPDRRARGSVRRGRHLFRRDLVLRRKACRHRHCWSSTRTATSWIVSGPWTSRVHQSCTIDDYYASELLAGTTQQFALFSKLTVTDLSDPLFISVHFAESVLAVDNPGDLLSPDKIVLNGDRETGSEYSMDWSLVRGSTTVVRNQSCDPGQQGDGAPNDTYSCTYDSNAPAPRGGAASAVHIPRSTSPPAMALPAMVPNGSYTATINEYKTGIVDPIDTITINFSVSSSPAPPSGGGGGVAVMTAGPFRRHPSRWHRFPRLNP